MEYEAEVTLTGTIVVEADSVDEAKEILENGYSIGEIYCLNGGGIKSNPSQGCPGVTDLVVKVGKRVAPLRNASAGLMTHTISTNLSPRTRGINRVNIVGIGGEIKSNSNRVM